MRGKFVNDIAARFVGRHRTDAISPRISWRLPTTASRQSMIPKSGYRFSEKIMLIGNLKRDEHFIPLFRSVGKKQTARTWARAAGVGKRHAD
jgi:hypothetical protein